MVFHVKHSLEACRLEVVVVALADRRAFAVVEPAPAVMLGVWEIPAVTEVASPDRAALVGFVHFLVVMQAEQALLRVAVAIAGTQVEG